MSITAEEARTMVGQAVRRIVPDADVESLPPEADLRRTYELDSLDFLSFVELLTAASGVRLDEEDYPELTTTAGCTELLVRRTS